MAFLPKRQLERAITRKLAYFEGQNGRVNIDATDSVEMAQSSAFLRALHPAEFRRFYLYRTAARLKSD